MAILGIDLGTTNSLGAVFKDGNVQLIPNSIGEYLTPSVVSVDSKGNIITGAVAREMLITRPKSTVSEFKRDMGLSKDYTIAGKTFKPEDLSSFIIRSIVNDAERFLNEEIKDVIISVPAYFYDSQRVATKQAGVLAGVNVLRIINEPSAAALSAYYQRNQEEMFLVFDFGGGTLDISIVDCFDTIVEIMGVAGDNQLGGKDIDAAIADDFLLEHGISKDKVSISDRKKLLRSSERCKIALTEKESVSMFVRIEDKEYESIFDNERLIKICTPVFARIKGVLERVFLSSGLSVNDISKVILVGGSSNMPVIKVFLKMLFKDKPLVSGNASETVARGLGLYTGIIERYQGVADFVMTDLCPFSIGTSVNNEKNPENPYMSVIIPKNSILPISRTESFTAVNLNQKEIRFDIIQGENAYANRNKKLGELIIDLPRNQKEKETVDVTYSYDIDGILVVDGKINSNGKTFHKVISNNYSEKNLAAKIENLNKLKMGNDQSDVTKYIKGRLESLYQEIDSDRQLIVLDYIRQYDAFLSSGDMIRRIKFEKYITDIINAFDNYDPFETVQDTLEEEDKK